MEMEVALCSPCNGLAAAGHRGNQYHHRIHSESSRYPTELDIRLKERVVESKSIMEGCRAWDPA